MANPRKFSEKIALLNQKQAEGTAAFEEIMREVGSATRDVQAKIAKNGKPQNHLHINPALRAYGGGSLPNVNQISNNSIDLQVDLQQSALISLEDIKQGRDGFDTRSYNSRDSPNRHMTARRSRPFDKRMESSPYYLSPPPDTSWRRTNSDSALHQSAIQADSYHLSNTPPTIRRVPDDGSFTVDNSFIKDYWDAKKDSNCLSPLMHARPKSCEVPGINIYHSEQEPGGIHIPISNNTGSLPDLSNLQFPPPLATPLDVEDQATPPYNTSPANLSPVNMASGIGGMSPHNSPRKRIDRNLTDLVIGGQQITAQANALRLPSLHTRYLHTCKGLALESQNAIDPYKQTQYSLYHTQHSSQPIVVASGSIAAYRSTSPAETATTGGSAPPSPVSASFSLSNSPTLGSSSSPKTITYDQTSYYIPAQVQNITANSVQQRFEEFNLMDSVPASSSFLPSTSGLHYSQVQGNGQDVLSDASYYTSNQIYQQNPPHTPQTPNSIPDIVLTDFSTCSTSGGDSISRQEFVKDISSAMAGMTGAFDSDLFPSDDALKVGLDPIDLQMLTDPDLVTDSATEDLIRLDHL